MPWWDSTVNQPKLKSRFIVVFGDMFIPSIKTITKPSFEVDTKTYKLMNHHFNYPGTVKWNPVSVSLVCMNPSDLRQGSEAPTQGLDTSELLWQIIQNSGYYYPDAPGHALGRLSSGVDELGNQVGTTISSPEKASMIANGFGPGLYGRPSYQPGGSSSNLNQRVKIIQVTSGENEAKQLYPVEQWDLINPMVRSINFGDLSYDDDALVEYTLDITYDYAKYEKYTTYRNPIPINELWQSYSKDNQSLVDQFLATTDSQVGAGAEAARREQAAIEQYQRETDPVQASIDSINNVNFSDFSAARTKEITGN